MRITRNVLLGMVYGVLATSPVAKADDTDIFLGKDGQGAQTVEPTNLFFLLDSSSSMGDVPSGDTRDKLTLMKEAMEDILSVKGPDDTLRNVNVGYGTFYAPAGLIDYPILPIDGPGLSGGSVRDELINSINNISWEFTWGTPLASAYYESMAYMMAKPVVFGNNATPTRPLTSNPVAFDTAVPPRYNFDGLTDAQCAANAIVLLSDGMATVEGYADMVTNDPATFSALDVETDDGSACENSYGTFERCGRELAKYAYERGDSADPDAAPIYTHTIGFDISEDSTAEHYLQDVANAGGGQYHRVTSKEQLINSFLNIVNRVVETTSAFSAPSVPVSIDNRLYSSSEIFLNVFQTERKPIWNGNVKKFDICRPEDIVCDPGDYLGSGGAKATDADGNLLQTGVGDVWHTSGSPSAATVTSGGIGSKVQDWTSRRIFTWTAPNYPTTFSATGGASTRGLPLYQIDHTKEVITDTTLEPDLSNTTDIPGSIGRLRKRLHQAHGHCDVAGGIATDCMSNLIAYLLGQKTRAEQTDGPVAGNRWPIADILHSEVKTVPYGRTATGEIVSKIVFGTNDGGLHMHDAETGAEDFVIYPQEVLDELANLESAQHGTQHIYGLDGAPTIRIRDADKDYSIEPEDGDFVHLYIGMRRGGYSYYAFNITPNATLNDHGQSIGEPELLWTLRGTTDATSPVHRLAQTWSAPQTARITINDGTQDVPKTVLIFGGGYDAPVEDVEGQFGAGPSGSNLGNAIYIVDADNGDVLWWASSDYNAASATAGLVVDDMTASIAGDLSLVDSNNDRRIDRIYAADLAGQVWRVDLHADLSDNTVGKLAALSQSGDPLDPQDNADERKFFYQPDFVRVNDTRYVNSDPQSQNYDVVALVSGNRADPTDDTVVERAYVIRDYLDDELMVPFGSSNPTNYPACNPDSSVGCTVANTIDNSGLMNLSNVVIDRNSDASTDPQAQALAAANGYYFDLLDAGELGFGKTQVLAGKLYFSTYDPGEGPTVSETVVDGAPQCSVDLGESKMYIVDLVSGSPILGNATTSTAQDRALSVGSQPLTAAVPMILPSDTGGSILEAAHQAGAQLPGDPAGTPMTFFPTFWYQE